MALTDAFPGASGVADSVDLRKGLAGLIVRDTAGVPRSGIFPRHTNSLVFSRGDMRVDIWAFAGVSVRGGGPLFMANDGTVVSPTLPIPAANSQISVLYFKQNENGYNGFADGSITPVFGVETGTAAASPTKPSIAGIAGATELATITVPSTATATNSSGVVITNTFQHTTTAGGLLLVRSSSEYPALPVYGQRVDDIALGYGLRFDGTGWQRVTTAGRLFSGSTDNNGILVVNHNFGSAPTWAVCSSGNQSTEALNLILSPIIWAITSTTVSVRFRRNDTNAWATTQPVVGYLNVGA